MSAWFITAPFKSLLLRLLFSISALQKAWSKFFSLTVCLINMKLNVSIYHFLHKSRNFRNLVWLYIDIFFLKASSYSVCKIQLVSKQTLHENFCVLGREKLLIPTFLLFEVLQRGLGRKGLKFICMKNLEPCKSTKRVFYHKNYLTVSGNNS